MAGKAGLNLQENFLNQARRDGTLVGIRLVTGTELRGRIDGFDNFTVILVDNNTRRHMIYKHAIANVTMLGSPRRRSGGKDSRGSAESGKKSQQPRPAQAEKAVFNPTLREGLAGLVDKEAPPPEKPEAQAPAKSESRPPAEPEPEAQTPAEEGGGDTSDTTGT